MFRKQCYLIVLSVEKIQKKSPGVAKTKKGKPMLLPKYALWDSKESSFIKEQGASWFFSSLGIMTPISKNHFVGPLYLKHIK